MKKYTHREIIREFLLFLKTNDAYKNYAQNIKIQKKNSFKSWINYINPLTIRPIQLLISEGEYGELINSAFTWSHTKEGHDFWSELDTEWRKKIQKIELKHEKIN